MRSSGLLASVAATSGAGAVTMKNSDYGAPYIWQMRCLRDSVRGYGRIRRDLAKNEEDDDVVGRADIFCGSRLCAGEPAGRERKRTAAFRPKSQETVFKRTRARLWAFWPATAIC